MRIGLVVHPGRAPSVAAAAECARLLDSLRVDVVVGADGRLPDVPARHVGAGAFTDDLDLVVSLGGDGTFLRAAHRCRDAGIPLLGVNVGRLGFLAEVELEDLPAALKAVTDDRHTIAERPTLRVAVETGDGEPVHRDWALNEVSVEKSARQRVLLMEVRVSGTMFAEVPADALVVATATGSTAYALSAGGPIVSPQVEATLVVPVAPHTLFDRTLVAGPGEPVRVDVLPDQAPAVVSCDGREPVEVPAGGRITAVGGSTPVRVARVEDLDFYGLVRHKFGLD